MSTSTMDSFLEQILQSIATGDGQRATKFLVLNLDALPPSQQKPYNDLYEELNAHFPSTKDGALSTKIRSILSTDVLRGSSNPFCEAIASYFRYVRNFFEDSSLIKARKIEKITIQCISAMHPDPPGPTMIPIVLFLTNTLRQIAINLDHDPELRAVSNVADSNSDSDIQAISYVERTGNTLREAFNKIIRISRPTQPPSATKLDSALYLIMNSCMRIYLRAGKLNAADSLLQHIDRNSPPLTYYPVSQRVTYLYYLGVFYFNSNLHYRAYLCLQSAYDQSPKSPGSTKQRELILIHLIAASLCLGRLPMAILFLDTAAHNIRGPFLVINQAIKTGNIGLFHAMTDASLPSPYSDCATWLLARKILLQIKNRCEILVWRTLIFKAFKHAGFLGSNEEGKKASMPWVRLGDIHRAACFSYEIARKAVWEQTHGEIDLWQTGFDDGGVDEYVDPDFLEGSQRERSVSVGSSDGSIGSSPQPDGMNGEHIERATHPPLHDPTPEEVNSVVLSLIYQGFLRGFISHNMPDILTSRFAIRGATSVNAMNGHRDEMWKEIGFPIMFEVVQEKGEKDVPGWITEEKVRTRAAAGGGGRIVNLTGVGGVAA